MRHEMLTQRALFCHRSNTKRGTLTQHFVMVWYSTSNFWGLLTWHRSADGAVFAGYLH